jgi:hypothetical protein
MDVTATDPQNVDQDDGFAAIVEALSTEDGVTLGSGGRGFGSHALCVNGRIFAIPKPGAVVLKLPSHQVAELIAHGEGTPFDAGKGRPMKEWVVLGPQTEHHRWIQLAHEARAFVAVPARR